MMLALTVFDNLQGLDYQSYDLTRDKVFRELGVPTSRVGLDDYYVVMPRRSTGRLVVIKRQRVKSRIITWIGLYGAAPPKYVVRGHGGGNFFGAGIWLMNSTIDGAAISRAVEKTVAGMAAAMDAQPYPQEWSLRKLGLEDFGTSIKEFEAIDGQEKQLLEQAGLGADEDLKSCCLDLSNRASGVSFERAIDEAQTRQWYQDCCAAYVSGDREILSSIRTLRKLTIYNGLNPEASYVAPRKKPVIDPRDQKPGPVAVRPSNTSDGNSAMYDRLAQKIEESYIDVEKRVQALAEDIKTRENRAVFSLNKIRRELHIAIALSLLSLTTIVLSLFVIPARVAEPTKTVAAASPAGEKSPSETTMPEDTKKPPAQARSIPLSPPQSVSSQNTNPNTGNPVPDVSYTFQQYEKQLQKINSFVRDLNHANARHIIDPTNPQNGTWKDDLEKIETVLKTVLQDHKIQTTMPFEKKPQAGAAQEN